MAVPRASLIDILLYFSVTQNLSVLTPFSELTDVPPGFSDLGFQPPSPWGYSTFLVFIFYPNISMITVAVVYIRSLISVMVVGILSSTMLFTVSISSEGRCQGSHLRVDCRYLGFHLHPQISGCCCHGWWWRLSTITGHSLWQQSQKHVLEELDD